MSSILILNIKIPLKSIIFDEERLIINRMDIDGNYFSRTNNKLENFSFYNDDEDNIFFEKDLYSLFVVKENKTNCTGSNLYKERICEGLNFLLKKMIKEEIEKYYSQ